MLISYPGAKDNQNRGLVSHLTSIMGEGRLMAEPFGGTAATTFAMLKRKELDSYWINDVDETLMTMWSVVKSSPKELCLAIDSYKPTVADFDEFRGNPGDDDFTRAFRKMVLHQISYAGLGARTTSPLGGRNQAGATTVGSRWNSNRLKLKVRHCSALLNSVPGKITSLDWNEAMNTMIKEKFALYIDPPSVVRGSSLFIYGTIDHEELSELLRANPTARWIMSYDDTRFVRDLYTWADIKVTKASTARKKVGDILVLPPQPAW